VAARTNGAQSVQIVAGRDLSLDLTADNAEIVPLDDVAIAVGRQRFSGRPVLSKYQESVVAVWSPTARASGFVVDSRGLIATDGRAVGTATVVDVQLSPTVKVPATVLVSERSRDVAIRAGRSKPRCHPSGAGTGVSAVTRALARRWSGDCEHRDAARRREENSCVAR
jgi:S1-C subfamily serine protease